MDSIDRYVLRADELTHFLDLAYQEFHPLDSKESDKGINAYEVLSSLQATFWEIENSLKSAWGRHIPFLFSLMQLEEPRRYVELGVDRGASFFAACQAIERVGMDCESIAIDHWQGDHQAGSQTDEVFQGFRRLLEARYPKIGGYIRADFTTAVEQFSEGSVDILHIDGLHTFESVHRDFSLWASTLSDRGIVLLHDTNEYKKDFGVWRLWKQLRKDYDVLEFGHEHGLGVVFVGSESRTYSLYKKARSLFGEEHINEFAQILFGGAGEISWALYGKG